MKKLRPKESKLKFKPGAAQLCLWNIVLSFEWDWPVLWGFIFLIILGQLRTSCISYLLLHNKLPPNWAASDNTHLFSYSFCGSGIWAQSSWVSLIQGLMKLQSRCQTGLQSYKEAQLGARIHFQVHSWLSDRLKSPTTWAAPQGPDSWLLPERQSQERERERQEGRKGGHRENTFKTEAKAFK